MISVCSARTIQASPSSIQLFFPRNRRRITPDVLRFSVNLSTRSSDYDEYGEAQSERRANFAGIRLEETVDVNPGKVRLDSWISCRINGISRARVQSSIRAGLVSVNGRIIDKVSHNVKAGDMINCTISELQPLRAEPEDIDLDIVYEDAHVLVVNKPAHMVVHPAPGNATGTLVNAILNHCSLPMVATSKGELPSDMDISDDEFSSVEIFSRVSEAPIRPGIVHRLDKGTSGLLVVAKDEHSHAHLSAQFKLHSIERVYISLTCGVPPSTAGRIEVPICRDPNNRIRMTAVSGTNNNPHAKHAASSLGVHDEKWKHGTFHRYKVMEILAQGGSSLVEWRLETGRTHQIRAHAKHMGIPLLGDDVYGGTKSMAMSLLRSRTSSSCHSQLMQHISSLERPCLHALTLGFVHPHTGKNIRFSCPPPTDFAEILSQLREIGTKKLQVTKS
ncbi:RNA pseudouridine synthase 2, chloroplastic isoform X3 [Benincasa hispida]|uniref:RNA pseudouridine synthase 2, chloroplastic isoform X3 n=1 Tax=Benincasa hispida TaxID=102211 RepID=UPI0019018EC1|nr:RNA pseudouridine synthase 2, chloroplastic isoform X3 [Benincasa hispida]